MEGGREGGEEEEREGVRRREVGRIVREVK